MSYRGPWTHAGGGEPRAQTVRMAAREVGRVTVSVAPPSDHREPPRGASDPFGHAECTGAGMKHSFLLPLALASGLILTACGARSSLTEPGVSDTCEPWSVHDGAATLVHYPDAPAVLDDGSVVVRMGASVGDANGVPDVTSFRSWLRKIDPDGAIAWETGGDPDGVHLLAAARDAANGIYVTGSAEPGAQSVLGAAVTCAGEGPCSFVAKLTQTGQPAWVKAFPSSSAADWSSLRDLAVTDDGRITLGGGFDGTLDLGCGPATGTTDGNFGSLFVAQLSPSGECLWSRAIGDVHPAVERMAVDDAGDIALVLTLEGPPGSSIDLGGGPIPFGSEHDLGSFAIAKYAPDGALVFAKVATCERAFVWPYVALTGAGEVLLSASCEGTIDLGGGPRGSLDVDRLFVTKFGATGEELWTHDIATISVGSAGPPAIATEPGGSFFLAGQARPGMALLGEPVPESALFVAAFDAGGSPIDMQTFPFMHPPPHPGFLDVSGLSASAGSLVLAGYFDGALDLGQSPLVSKGPQDAFVARICR